MLRWRLCCLTSASRNVCVRAFCSVCAVTFRLKSGCWPALGKNNKIPNEFEVCLTIFSLVTCRDEVWSLVLERLIIATNQTKNTLNSLHTRKLILDVQLVRFQIFNINRGGKHISVFYAVAMLIFKWFCSLQLWTTAYLRLTTTSSKMAAAKRSNGPTRGAVCMGEAPITRALVCWRTSSMKIDTQRRSSFHLLCILFFGSKL